MKILIGTREYEVPVNALAQATGVSPEFLGGTCSVEPVAQPSGPSTPATRTEALAALNGTLKHFIGGLQRRCLIDNFRGEERQYFYDKVVALAKLVEAMPKTYETDGQGQDAIAHLHYFAGGRANWYITEKDKGCEDDGPDGNQQQQATGHADLFGDGGEFGYISIAEILANNGELDFYWTPKPLKEILDNET